MITSRTPWPRRPRRGGISPEFPFACLARARSAGRIGVRPDRRRARHRKVASDRGIPRKARRNAAHLGRMGRLAAPAEHAPASTRPNGADYALARRIRDRRGASRRPREQLGLIGLDATECAPARAAGRHSATGGSRGRSAAEELRRRQLAAMTAWVLAGARYAAGGLAFEDLHWADPTSLDHGPARRARRAVSLCSSSPPRAGNSERLGDALTPRRRFTRAARPRPGARWSTKSQTGCALRRDDRWSGRATGRRPAIRRGGDERSARARRAGRRPGDPADPAAIARRPA